MVGLDEEGGSGSGNGAGGEVVSSAVQVMRGSAARARP